MAPAVEDRKIGFGAHKGEPAWQEVPGEYRAMLRRLIVVQGDTEPASVEQQRHLGATAPSLYDLRNLFQVNVEEARHLWAMVYLLQKYFGRDGREEAEELLRRRSGDRDSPRLLGAFNEATPDWLSFFMFTFFTDRDGKMQLHALSQSGFDPLSRTCRFMLTEEAHHMFVGQSGVGRIIERTCAAMREAGIDDPTDIERVRALGVIDLPTMQKRANLHFSLTLDLFGSEISTNAANAFNAGLKGRYLEDQIDDDHRLLGRDLSGAAAQGRPHRAAKTCRPCRRSTCGCATITSPTRPPAIERWWNRIIARAGFDFRIKLPHVAFNRHIGEFAAIHADPDGNMLSAEEWQRRRDAVPAVHRRRSLHREPDAAGHRTRRLSPRGSRRRAPASTASRAISSM